MRRPRLRYSVGSLLLLGIFVGLVCWVVVIPPAEQQAWSAYQQAMLHSELAEYAVKEFEQGVSRSAPTRRLSAPLDPLGPSRTRQEQILQNLRAKVALARAEERSNRAIYRAERSRRLGIFA